VEEPLNAAIGVPAVFDQEYYQNGTGKKPMRPG
jgi:hypothetical protein